MELFSHLTLHFYGTSAGTTEATELWEDFIAQHSIPAAYEQLVQASTEEEIAAALEILIPNYTDQIPTLASQLAANRSKDLFDIDVSVVQAYLATLLGEETAFVRDLAKIVAELNNSACATYLHFLTNKTTQRYLSEATNSLSPGEIQQRLITFTVFEILMTVLHASTQSQILEADATQQGTNKCSNYIDLMRRAFFYLGTGVDLQRMIIYLQGSTQQMVHLDSEGLWNTPTVFSEDPKKFDLGYGHITLQEVFDYIQEQLKDKDTVSFTLNTGYWRSKFPSIFFDYSNHSQCTITLTKSNDAYSATADYKKISSQQITATASSTKSTNDAQRINNILAEAFYEGYTQAKERSILEISSSYDSYAPISSKLKFCWGTTPSGDGSVLSVLIGPTSDLSNDYVKNRYGTATQVRQQQNKAINTYVNAIKAKKDIISDLKNAQSQCVDDITSSMNRLRSILDSLIQQCKEIVDKIVQAK